jgi:hypothetical protein
MLTTKVRGEWHHGDGPALWLHVCLLPCSQAWVDEKMIDTPGDLLDASGKPVGPERKEG